MTLFKVLHRLLSFFKGGEGISAAQLIAEPVLKAESESQMADEHDRSRELDDLNVEDWPLENRFNFVANFLDSMAGNSRVTEPGRIIRASSLSSVSSSRLCSLHETSIQTYQTLNQKVETLEQQMNEISVFLAQSDLRREKLLARALAQLQSLSVAVHFESATINIPNDSEVEPMTPPTKDMDPMFLDTTTMGIPDTLPIYHLADYGLLEGNPCTSDTEVELITTLPSISSLKTERVPSIPNFCSATNCGTRILSANAVLEAETAPTPNLLQNHLSTTPMDSVCNSHFPGTKSPLSISKLLPDLLKESFVPRSAKHGLQNIILANSPIFVRGLPGGSAKTRPAGHRRGRPPRTPCEHSWQKVLLSFYDGRRRGRPPCSAAETLLLSWSHRPEGLMRGRPSNNYPRSCSRPNLSFCILGIGHYFCLIPILISRRVLND